MEYKYTILAIDPQDYFFNKHLHWFIKNHYYSFRSCLYGEMYINNIPKNSTYSVGKNSRRIHEDVPAPNPYGCKMFNLESKSHESHTIFIRTKAWLKNTKLKIKLENSLFEKILLANKKRLQNVFILCDTKVGKYFVHAGIINNIIPKKVVTKKVDSNILCENLNLINGFCYN